MRRCLVLGMAGTLACGSSSGPEPPATFSGTVEGRTFSPVEAMSASGSIAILGPGTATNMAVIVLSDAAGQCATFTANGELKSQMDLVIFLADVDPSSGIASAPTGIGSYAVIPFEHPAGSSTPPHAAFAELSGEDATCTLSIEPAEAKSGSVTLTSNAGAAFAGTLDLILHAFNDDYHVSGSFNTTACPGIIGYLNASQHTCN